MANSFKKLAMAAILVGLSIFAPSFPVFAQTCNPAIQGCS